jgi:uncharacterized damage-inducible protein DinB
MTPADVLRRQLDELSVLVMSLDTAAYRARPVPEVSGSIGEHVRHCLDHIAALIGRDASGATPLSYDRRQRGTEVEIDPAAALTQLMRMRAALEWWAHRRSDDPVAVSSLVSGEQSISGWSTLGREVAFVTSHTTHHKAVIALLLAVQGFAVPDRLGYAPSTPRRAM